MYALIKKTLFAFDAERSHTLAMKGLSYAHQLGLTRLLPAVPNNPKKVMGLMFKNPIGLAAGLDKNADYVDALGSLGFGFLEIGTVTPRPQTGNPKPRLFRLVEQQAIINRMGFNNKGVDYVARQLETIRYNGILGINIGKNKDTPLEKAAEDYLIGMRALWKFANYMTINISSPNTPGLRDLQNEAMLKELLSRLKREQQTLSELHGKYVPLAVKISPDLNEQAIQDIANVLLAVNIDGLIATNTTVQRNGVETSPFAKEAGGLSGQPLQQQNTEVIKQFYALLGEKIPIIAAGGIMNEQSAKAKIASGAKLLQIYTGFIYSGPSLVPRLAVLR